MKASNSDVKTERPNGLEKAGRDGYSDASLISTFRLWRWISASHWTRSLQQSPRFFYYLPHENGSISTQTLYMLI